MAVVSLIAQATERSVGVAAAVASGAGESLQLELEPATRLNAIAIEAASNVVAHAYADDPGPLELEICEPAGGGGEGVAISVRDSGGGFGPGPIPAQAPGLGLPMICSLADEVKLRSGKGDGTVLDAVINASGLQPGAQAEEVRRAGLNGEGSLEFEGPTFIEAVLPRTLATLVANGESDLDRLSSVLNVGDAIAYALSPWVTPSRRIRISWREQPPSEVRIGPLEEGGAEQLIDAIDSITPAREPWLELETAPDDGRGRYAVVGLPGNENRSPNAGKAARSTS